MSDKIVAAIRTGVAAAVAGVLVYAADRFGLNLPDGTAEIAGAALFGVVVGLYNLAVNALTEHVWDGFGYLLGIPKNPTY